MSLDANIYNALSVSIITDKLDTFLTGKALFSGTVAPQVFTGKKYITFYPVAPLNMSLEYSDLLYVVNCRAGTHAESRDIAETVAGEVGRKGYGDYILYCSVLATIPPRDDTDVFNTPVEIQIKKRG